MNETTSVRDRWMAGLCYLTILVFLPILSTEKTPFLARHCRQGFALLFAEIVAAVFLFVFHATVGRIPILGFLLVVAVQLAIVLLFLGVSVMGFIRAIFGEEWRIPYLDDLAERIPIEATKE